MDDDELVFALRRQIEERAEDLLLERETSTEARGLVAEQDSDAHQGFAAWRMRSATSWIVDSVKLSADGR